ncbi:MAG: cache domain-containing protein [Halopseudomonas sp.]
MKKPTLTARLAIILIVVLTGFTAITLFSIDGLKQALFQEKHLQTRFLVEGAETLLKHYYDESQSGTISEAEAKKRAIHALQSLRYGDANYFWINDHQPVLIMHPYNLEQVGQDLSLFKDPNGKFLFNEFVDVVEARGEGIVHYLWPKPGEDKPLEKISYVKGFKPWQWIIGSGIYVDDVEDTFLSSAVFLGIVSTSITLLVFTSVIIIRREATFQKKEYETIVSANDTLETQVSVRTSELEVATEEIKLSRDNAIKDKQRLEYSEAVFRGMAQAAQDAIILIDSNADVIFWNPSAERIFGYTVDEAMGQDLHSLIANTEEAELFRKAFPKFLATGSGAAIGKLTELTARRKSGECFPVELSLNSVVINHLWQALGIVRDISDRKHAEALLVEESKQQAMLILELKTTQTKLLQSEKMAAVGQLSAGVAHEINNPVGFISSNINSLKSYLNKLFQMLDEIKQATATPSSKEALATAISNIELNYEFDYIKEDLIDLISETKEGTDRIQKIVADLKGFARASDGEWETVELQKEIESTLNVVWNEIKYHCTVEKNYGDTPPIECLRSEINQVIMNLLINASQAIKDKGTIFIRTGCTDKSAWIEIEDTGKGIDADDLENIFDPFFTTKPVGVGTGLGLSVSYGIIEKHGGTLSATSTVGVGSQFRMTIPTNRSVA